MGRVADVRERIKKNLAPNYSPFPFFLPIREGGDWIVGFLEQEDGTEKLHDVLDMHSTYSALSLGHYNQKITDLEVKRILEKRPSLIPRGAMLSEELADFSDMLLGLCGMQMFIPKNDGYGAFDAAVKAARKWAHKKKGVPEGNAEIIVCEDNFHGRGLAAVEASSDPIHRDGFGPFAPDWAFRKIPFGDIKALKGEIKYTTAAFIVEPIQAEAGVIIPRDGYLSEARKICRENDVLFILDEVQTGLGRTGTLFAWQHDGRSAKPDGIILAKALGGGRRIISVFASSREVLGVLTEGTEGNTFAGNPEVCALATAALEQISKPELLNRTRVLGKEFLRKLRKEIKSPLIKEVRGRGLLIALELDAGPKSSGPGPDIARVYHERLFREGIFCIKRGRHMLGFSPPLTINEHNLLVWGFEKIRKVFEGGFTHA